MIFYRAKTVIPAIIIILILSVSITAIGIQGPIRYVEVFSPNKEFTVEYTIISNMPSMDVRIGTEAPEGMESYITSNTDKFFLKSGERKNVSVTIKMPPIIEQPGPHTFHIIAGESPPLARGQTAAASGAVKSRIVVFVPYPGKYVEGEIAAPLVQEGQDMAIDLLLRNFGSENIASLSADLEIYDHHGNVVERLKAYEPGNKNRFTISIAAEQTRKMYIDWEPKEGLKGSFPATAFINYDGHETTVNGTLIIGHKDVDIINTTQQIIKKGVQPYSVQFKSLWNQVLIDTFIDVEITNSSGNIIDTVRSSRFDVAPIALSSHMVYVNTERMELGNYSANIKLYVQGEKGRSDRVLLKEHDAVFELIEPLQPYTERPDRIKIPFMMIGLILLILIIIGGNVFLFLFMKKNKKEKKEALQKPEADDVEENPSQNKKGKKQKPKDKPAAKEKSEKDELERTAEQELAELENIKLD